MDGEQDATQTEGQQQEQQGGQAQQEAGQDAKANQPETVGSAEEWRKALAAKDAQIAELQGKVSAAAKTAEATEALNAEIAQLKQQMADERTEFALRAAGARSVKAAKAMPPRPVGACMALPRRHDAGRRPGRPGSSTAARQPGSRPGRPGRPWGRRSGLHSPAKGRYSGTRPFAATTSPTTA